MIKEIHFDKELILPLVMIAIVLLFGGFIIGLNIGSNRGIDIGIDAGWEECEEWYNMTGRTKTYYTVTRMGDDDGQGESKKNNS